MKQEPVVFKETFGSLGRTDFIPYYKTIDEKKSFIHGVSVCAKPIHNHEGPGVDFWVEITYDICSTHERKTKLLRESAKVFAGAEIGLSQMASVAAILDGQLSGKHAEDVIHGIYWNHYQLNSPEIQEYLPEYFRQVKELRVRDTRYLAAREKTITKKMTKKPGRKFIS